MQKITKVGLIRIQATAFIMQSDLSHRTHYSRLGVAFGHAFFGVRCDRGNRAFNPSILQSRFQ